MTSISILNQKIRVIALILLFLVGCSTPKQNHNPVFEEPEEVIPVVEEPIATTFRSVFNGGEVEEHEKYQPLSVIIENSSAARPHSGLSQADVVYEFAVDGFQITRFLAIFESTVPNKIGPVRSGRIPIVEIAKQWMLPFAHYGAAETGEGDAYSIIRNTEWPIRFDGVSGLNHSYFYRDSSRNAPHNAYFRGDDALERIDEMDVSSHFKFDDISNVEGIGASKISFEYSSQLKNTYEFNVDLGLYERFINDKSMIDLNTESGVKVKNILVIHAPHRRAEVHQYALIDFSNEGKAEFFVNGQHEEGLWKNQNGMIRFYKSSYEEIILLPGNTWIQVVHPQVTITIHP